MTAPSPPPPHPPSAFLVQKSRQAAAALLPPLTHLPPAMAFPNQKQIKDSVPTEKEVRENGAVA